MERPSHIIFDTRQPGSRRASFIAMAISLQLAGFWLFTYGLAGQIAKFIPPINFVVVHDKETPRVKPPEPVLKPVNQPVAPMPDYDVERPAGDHGITVVSTQPPPNDTKGAKDTTGLNRAAVGIGATHTVPPYPPIARRIGAEGKVTFRLIVSPEGRVTLAEVLASSGRDELDQTAQAWILAHWAYKPALENGVAVASQVLATVTFSLSDQR
jgi:protein TonB